MNPPEKYTDFLSGVEGAVFPAPVLGYAAERLALQYQLQQTQWLAQEQLQARQLAQLQLLLKHAVQHVPHYRNQSIEIDLNKPLSAEVWRSLPILSRSEVVNHQGSLFSEQVPKSHGKLFEQSSSGSTGKPVRINQTMLANLYWQGITLRDHLWSGRSFRGKFAYIRHLASEAGRQPTGMRNKAWGTATRGIFLTGESVGMHSAMDLDAQVDWLHREQPHYLLTYPSLVRGLLLRLEQRQLHLENLASVGTFGEVLDRATRELCREQYGIKIDDIYSAQETGYIALQCPEHEHYHVQSECVYVEILDTNNRPCSPGESGRVIVTPLHNFASPLIRYEIGDYATVGEQCDCERGLPVLKEIIGRSRNLLTHPDGRIQRPSVGIVSYRNIAPVEQVQLIQTSLTDVRVLIVMDGTLTEDQETRMRAEIIKQLDHEFAISIDYVDAIARGPTGKYEDFVSRIGS